jgi:hypothetical protein
LLSIIVIPALIAVLAGFMLGAVEIGYRQGVRAPSDETVVSHATAWEAALLGLLALLIGFSFAMAVTRFDTRRELIVDEANAIESVSLRARYLDPPAPDKVQALLSKYLDVRIRSYDVGMNWQALNAAHREAKALQHQLWDQAVVVARANPNSEVVASFVEAADEMVKAEARRRAALENHVPLMVYVVLVAVAATGMAATGYASGLHRRRLSLGMILMPLIIVVVIGLIVDLEYPRAGLIRAGQGAMLRLRQEL